MPKICIKKWSTLILCLMKNSIFQVINSSWYIIKHPSNTNHLQSSKILYNKNFQIFPNKKKQFIKNIFINQYPKILKIFFQITK